MAVNSWGRSQPVATIVDNSPMAKLLSVRLARYTGRIVREEKKLAPNQNVVPSKKFTKKLCL